MTNRSSYTGASLALLMLLAAQSLLVVLGKEPQPIQLVFAGFGKSGTRSLSVALTRLGYNTCHGMDLMYSKGAPGIFAAFAENRIDDALRLTEEEDCNATFEIHSWWWREIRQKRPKAKFLVVIRDYDSWERSMQHTLFAMQPMLRYPLRWVPMFELSARLMITAAQHSMSVGPDQAIEYLTNPTSETCIADRKRMYDRFVKDGLDFVKKEPKRALLFHLKDGYAPLCKFLDIDDSNCPTDEAFPHINTKWELTVAIGVFMMIEVFLFVFPLLAILVVARKLWLRSTSAATSTGTSSNAAVEDEKKHK